MRFSTCDPFRRCSSYQDFTQIGGSSESVDFLNSPSDGEGPSEKQRHVSRTLSEPSQVTCGRMRTLHVEQRGSRGVRHRNSRLSSHVCVCVNDTSLNPSGLLKGEKSSEKSSTFGIWFCFLRCFRRTPSPPDFSRRRACGPNQEEDYLPGHNTPPTRTDIVGIGSLTSRGQLGSRPHTPVGRVDIRPHDDPVVIPQTLYYAPASPKLEFKSTPNTPVTERWQDLSKVRTCWVYFHNGTN